MMGRIHEYVKHFLSIRDEETQLRNLQAVYDPYFKTIEIISIGGRCALNVNDVPNVIALLERVLELERGVTDGNQPTETNAD